MSKNKVVVYNTRKGGAKVFITDKPESIGVFADEIKLVNPDCSFVQDVPPELWNLENDKLMPIFDEEKIKERLANVGMRAMTNAVDQEVKENIANLVDIPERVDSLESALVCAIERLKKDMYDEFRDMNMHYESRALTTNTYTQEALMRTRLELEDIAKKSLKLILGFVGLVLTINLIHLVLLFNK